MLGLGFRLRSAAAGGYDFTRGVLPAGASVARSSAGSRIDAAGRLAMAAAGVARFDHDPVTLAARGLLVEPARTNALIQTAGFDTAAWSKSEVAIVANQGSAPDGTMSADLLLPSTANAQHFITQFVTATSGAVTLSVYAKPVSAIDRLTLIGSGGAPLAHFNLTAQTVTIEGNVSAADVTPAGDGWVRVRATLAAGTSYNRFRLYASSGALGNSALAGDGSAGLLLWGAQFEEAGDASSYVPGDTVAATRAADVPVLDLGRHGVADGPVQLRVIFDDLSVQLVALVVSGGLATVAGLARTRVRRVELV